MDEFLFWFLQRQKFRGAQVEFIDALAGGMFGDVGVNVFDHGLFPFFLLWNETPRPTARDRPYMLNNPFGATWSNI